MERAVLFPHDVDANAIFIQGTYRYVYSNGDEGQWEDCSSNIPVINACSVEDWVRIEFDLELFVEDKDHRRLVMHENDPAYAIVFGSHHFIIWNSSRAHGFGRGVQGEVGASLKLKLSKKDHAGGSSFSRALCWERRWGEESATVRHDEWEHPRNWCPTPDSC